MARAAQYNRDVALDAAMSIFWKKGFHATSLKDLETALKMKPGSIYAAFSSKSNLYLLALERYYETLKERFLTLKSASASPLTGLSNELRFLAALPADHELSRSCMLMKTILDTDSTDKDIAERAKMYLSDLCEIIASVFEHSKVLNELAPNSDSHRLARRFQASIMAVRFRIHQGGSKSEIIELADDLAQEFERLRCC